MVKPGGTGRPIRHISARFAPLPPSSGFIVPLPSVLRPNRYTYFPRSAVFVERPPAAGFFAFLVAVFAISNCSLLLQLPTTTCQRWQVELDIWQFPMTPSQSLRYLRCREYGRAAS